MTLTRTSKLALATALVGSLVLFFVYSTTLGIITCVLVAIMGIGFGIKRSLAETGWDDYSDTFRMSDGADASRAQGSVHNGGFDGGPSIHEH